MLELGCVDSVEGEELVQLTVKQCFGHVVEGHSGDGCLRTVQHHVEAHDHSLYLLEDIGVTELDNLRTHITIKDQLLSKMTQFL